MDEIGIRIQSLREKLIKRIGEETEVRDDRVQDIIDELIMEEGRETYISLPQKQQVRIELFNSIRGLDILQELLDDDDVTEIMVNGTGGNFCRTAGTDFKMGKAFFLRGEIARTGAADCSGMQSDCKRIGSHR